MRRQSPFNDTFVALEGSPLPATRLLAIIALQSTLLLSACGRTRDTIALIPRTCGTPLWEPEHAGADSVARTMNYRLYWNAPLQENDTQKQIFIMDQALSRKYKGIIVSPDETLAFRSPVLNVAAHHVPVVVVDTELELSPNNYISYLLNDEVAGGELAAHRVGEVLHGQGIIVLLGINPRLLSMTIRQRSFEQALARDYPNIRISIRRLGDLSVPHEQEVTEELIHSDQHIDAIVALSASATRGAYYALLEAKRVRSIVLIGYDQDMFGPVRAGEIDAIVVQNTYEMGRIAIKRIDDVLKRKTIPSKTVVPPILLTLDNLDSPAIQQILSYHYYKWDAQH
jgi:ribose transport system substrate-binding protein